MSIISHFVHKFVTPCLSFKYMTVYYSIGGLYSKVLNINEQKIFIYSNHPKLVDNCLIPQTKHTQSVASEFIIGRRIFINTGNPMAVNQSPYFVEFNLHIRNWYGVKNLRCQQLYVTQFTIGVRSCYIKLNNSFARKKSCFV